MRGEIEPRPPYVCGAILLHGRLRMPAMQSCQARRPPFYILSRCALALSALRHLSPARAGREGPHRPHAENSDERVEQNDGRTPLSLPVLPRAVLRQAIA